jgi:hypothetical protein
MGKVDALACSQYLQRKRSPYAELDKKSPDRATNTIGAQTQSAR